MSIQVFALTSRMTLFSFFSKKKFLNHHFKIIVTSVHGEYRLSPLEMPPPANGERLSGFDLCNYMEKFADKFLVGRAKFHFQTEVLDIERDGHGKWNVAVEDLPTKSLRTLTFSRIILATGVSRISTIFGIFLRSLYPHCPGMQQSKGTKYNISNSRGESAFSWDCHSFFPVWFSSGSDP